MKRAAIACFLLPALLLTACRPELTPQEATLTAVGQLAPSFELTTLDGETFDLDAQHGKVVLVNFFATWCPPCRQELPHLENEVWHRFKDAPFSLLVVGRGESPEVLEEFLDKTGYSFPVASDPDRSAYGLYASQYIPRNVLIGPDGIILFQSNGYDENEFNEMVTLIAETVDDVRSAHPGVGQENRALSVAQ